MDLWLLLYHWLPAPCNSFLGGKLNNRSKINGQWSNYRQLWSKDSHWQRQMRRGQQGTKCPKKHQLSTNFTRCKSTIWPGNGIFAEKNQPIINLFHPKTLQKKFDLQLRSAGKAECAKWAKKLPLLLKGVKKDRNRGNPSAKWLFEEVLSFPWITRPTPLLRPASLDPCNKN